MPKIQPDHDLLFQVNKIVEKYGGCSPAAKYIGVDKATLWRFLKTGCAIERTRTTLRKAVELRKSATSIGGGGENETNLGKLATLSLDDLQRIKSMFQTMILVIDSYELSVGRSGAEAESRVGAFASSMDCSKVTSQRS
jgi:hypothetical protein